MGIEIGFEISRIGIWIDFFGKLELKLIMELDLELKRKYFELNW